MTTRALPLLAAALLLGCGDFISAVRDRAAGAAEQATGEAPEGWESLEDEGKAVRLYYQFVDEKRQVRFVERLEDVPPELRATVGFVKMAVPPPLSPGDAARARRSRSGGGSTRVASATGGDAAVVLYSADWCGACRKAKRYLTKRGIDFEERDIDEPRFVR